jgi:hypothetical protein
MGRLAVACAAVLALAGCMAGPTASYPLPGQSFPAANNNPLLVPVADHHAVWETMVGVIVEYFRIEREEPIRLVGATLTEGRLETYPKNGATIFEPWDGDSANSYERMESTLQSIRRRAVVRVVPAQTGGFWIEVVVLKELEDLAQPEHSTAGAATFRNDLSFARVVNPDRVQNPSRGWISMGRDAALEQQIIAQLQYRFLPMGAPVMAQ